MKAYSKIVCPARHGRRRYVIRGGASAAGTAAARRIGRHRPLFCRQGGKMKGGGGLGQVFRWWQYTRGGMPDNRPEGNRFRPSGQTRPSFIRPNDPVERTEVIHAYWNARCRVAGRCKRRRQTGMRSVLLRACRTSRAVQRGASVPNQVIIRNDESTNGRTRRMGETECLYQQNQVRLVTVCGAAYVNKPHNANQPQRRRRRSNRPGIHTVNGGGGCRHVVVRPNQSTSGNRHNGREVVQLPAVCRQCAARIAARGVRTAYACKQVVMDGR